ncbi:MAG: MASE1 domain-containing protein [Fibrobacterales bacterium]
MPEKSNQAIPLYIHIFQNVLLAGLYFGTAKLGQLFSIPPGNITAIWLPSGIILAAICIKRGTLLPGVFLGALLGNATSYFDTTTLFSVISTIFCGISNGLGDMLCAYIGYLGCKKALTNHSLFNDFNQLSHFLLYAVIIGPFISALFGITSLGITGLVPWDSYLFSFVTWWVGDSVGVLLLTPPLLHLWFKRNDNFIAPFKSIIFFVSLFIITIVILDFYNLLLEFNLPLFILCPLLAWSVFKLDSRVSYCAIPLVAALAIASSITEYGPFSSPEIMTVLIELQLFIATLAVTVYIMLIFDYQRKHSLSLMEKSKEKAEESEKLKTSFLANMSHEIRTPLNAIIGFSNLLKSPDLSEIKRKAYLTRIEKRGKHLLRLISNILDLSILESNKITLYYDSVNVNEIIESVYQNQLSQISSEVVALYRQCELPQGNEIINTDKQRLKQILTILIDNAFKFTESGSVDFGCTQHGSDLFFHVKDTGLGIPIDQQKHIFDRFRKGDIENIATKSGAGLGLTIAKGLLTLLNGEIWVTSTPGQGSCFFFTIPTVPESKDIN